MTYSLDLSHIQSRSGKRSPHKHASRKTYKEGLGVGLVLCDMAPEEASPRLWHLRLPMYYDPNYYTKDLLALGL